MKDSPRLADPDPVVEAHKKDIDRTLIRWTSSLPWRSDSARRWRSSASRKVCGVPGGKLPHAGPLRARTAGLKSRSVRPSIPHED